MVLHGPPATGTVSKGSELVDRFEFDWKKRRYIPNSL